MSKKKERVMFRPEPYVMDPATGLPALPEGYFWRVRRSSAPFVRVSIRRKQLFWSRLVGWTVRDRIGLTKDSILYATEYILRYDRDTYNHFSDVIKDRQPDTARQFYGDYPPRSI